MGNRRRKFLVAVFLAWAVMEPRLILITRWRVIDGGEPDNKSSHNQTDENQNRDHTEFKAVAVPRDFPGKPSVETPESVLSVAGQCLELRQLAGRVAGGIAQRRVRRDAP